MTRTFGITRQTRVGCLALRLRNTERQAGVRRTR
jgi:hypothetical protein